MRVIAALKASENNSSDIQREIEEVKGDGTRAAQLMVRCLLEAPHRLEEILTRESPFERMDDEAYDTIHIVGIAMSRFDASLAVMIISALQIVYALGAIDEAERYKMREMWDDKKYG